MSKPIIYSRGDTTPIVVRLRDRLGQPLVPDGKVIRFTAKLEEGYQDAPDAAAIMRKSTDDGSLQYQGIDADGWAVYHVLPSAAETESFQTTTKLVCDVEIEYGGGQKDTVNWAPSPSDDPIKVHHLTVVADVTRGA